MKRTKPPYRADHVGSFLRSAPIKEAREKRREGADQRRRLEEGRGSGDSELIKKQEEVGLQLATDGEYRRSWWHFEFLRAAPGRGDSTSSTTASSSRAWQTKAAAASAVMGKLGFGNHPMLEHFKFLKANTKVTPKMCIPAPTVMHFRLEPGAVDNQVLSGPRLRSSTISPRPYRQAVKGFLRRRLPLPAVRRHRLGLPSAPTSR